LNAQVVAYKLANLLESGWHFRRAGYNMLQNVVNAGAAGCETRISGKLTGPRSRSEKFSDGYIKHTGEIPEGLVSKGFAIAKCKSGVIGVKVSIIPPNIELPDDFHISVDSPKVNQISQREIGQHQGEVDGDTSSG
jgi:small subunit ribosomal protein S3